MSRCVGGAAGCPDCAFVQRALAHRDARIAHSERASFVLGVIRPRADQGALSGGLRVPALGRRAPLHPFAVNRAKRLAPRWLAHPPPPPPRGPPSGTLQPLDLGGGGPPQKSGNIGLCMYTAAVIQKQQHRTFRPNCRSVEFPVALPAARRIAECGCGPSRNVAVAHVAVATTRVPPVPALEQRRPLHKRKHAVVCTRFAVSRANAHEVRMANLRAATTRCAIPLHLSISVA
eukprot:gene23101-biopygen22280